MEGRTKDLGKEGGVIFFPLPPPTPLDATGSLSSPHWTPMIFTLKTTIDIFITDGIMKYP